MTPFDAGIWGGLGGIVVIGLEFWTEMNRNHGKFLQKQRTIPFWIGQLARVAREP